MHIRRSLPLAALLAAFLGCGSGDGGARATIPVVVDEVIVDSIGHPLILLKEREGTRSLPIWVGIAEARSIASRLERIEPPRPNTHDLATRLLEGLDGTVERVVVTELRRRTYYGLIVMEGPDGRVEIDSRPSDAIAIALRTGASIFVAEELFEAESLPGGRAPGEVPPDDEDETRRAI